MGGFYRAAPLIDRFKRNRHARPMIFGSCCSGIEAASVAWNPLGWKAAFFSEIEPFPCNLLRHHYPDVPNYGDMNAFKAWPDARIDLLVGGSPCQSFSVAGLRKGLDDPRGNLTLTYLAVADRYRPRWLVWENVPGVLSVDGGRAFGTLLGGMAKLGYGFAYRILDAAHLGVPQRRRRIFVVGYLGDWRRAAAVLFERHGLQGHPPPSREARKDAAPTLAARTRGGGGLGTDFDLDGGLIASTGDTAHCLNAGGMGRQDYETETLIAHALRADGFDASEDGSGRGTPLVPIAMNLRGRDGGAMPELDELASLRAASGGSSRSYIAFDETQITSRANYSNPQPGDPSHPLASGARPPTIAFSCKDYGADVGDLAPTLRSMNEEGGNANAGGQVAVAFDWQSGGDSRGLDPKETAQHQRGVRRLTPLECERLMGMPDGYTLVPNPKKPAKDGPRYKALGNSIAIPPLRWIGERIDRLGTLLAEQA